MMTKTDGALVVAQFTEAGPEVMIRRVEKTRSSWATWHVFYGGQWVSGPHLDPRDAYKAAGTYGYRHIPRSYLEVD